MKHKTKTDKVGKASLSSITSREAIIPYLKSGGNPEALVTFLLEERKYSPFTTRNYLIDARKAFPELAERLRVPGVQILKANYQNKVAKATESTKRILIDPKEFRATALRLIASDSVVNRALGVAALTGRRIGEVFNTKAFKVTGKDFLFSGQLKDSGLQPPYKVTPLAPVVQVAAAIKKLPLLTSAEVNLKFGSTLNRYAKVAFPYLRKAHDLRGIYTLIRYHELNVAATDKSFRKFAQEVLGHNPANLSLASEAYTNVYAIKGAKKLIEDEPAPVAPVRVAWVAKPKPAPGIASGLRLKMS